MARPELLDKRPGWSGGKLNATTMLLEPLGESDSIHLVDQLLAGEPLADDLKHSVREIAEGNPFFCEQLIAFARESTGERIAVPATIQAVLAARLDQLDPAERRVLAAGSVEGRRFHRSAVAVLTADEGDLESHLAALVRRELIRPDRSQLAGETAFRFRHLLIRDAAYEALPKSLRSELHQRFAAWMREHGDQLAELDEILGYHLEQAFRYRAELGPVDPICQILGDEAALFLHRAGLRARDRGDISASVNLLSRARVLSPGSADRAQLDLDFVQCLSLAGNVNRGYEVARMAEKEARGRADSIGAMRLRVEGARMGVYAGIANAHSHLRAVVEEALPVLERVNDHAGLTMTLLGVAELASGSMHEAACVAAADGALEHALASDDAGKAGEALIIAAEGRVLGPEPVADSLAWCGGQAPPDMARPRFDCLWAELHAMNGEFEAARELLASSIAQMRLLGLVLDEAVSAASRWMVEQLAGDPESALASTLVGLELFAERGEPFAVSDCAHRAAESLLDMGRIDEAARWLERATVESPIPSAINLVFRCSVEARIQAHRGDGLGAMELIDRADSLLRDTDAIAVNADLALAKSSVLRLIGRDSESIDAKREALRMYSRKGNRAMMGRIAQELGITDPEDRHAGGGLRVTT